MRETAEARAATAEAEAARQGELRRAGDAALLEHEAAARTTADEADTVRRLATAALSAERAWRVRATAAAAAPTPTSAPALPTGAASPSAASPSVSPSALPSSPSERRGARPSALSAAARFREAEAAEGLLQREQDARRRMYLRLKAEQSAVAAAAVGGAAFTVVKRRLDSLG